MRMSRIIFDRDALINQRKLYIDYGFKQSTNGTTTPFSIVTSNFFARNFFMGMKSFKFDNLSDVNFTTLIATTTTVSATTSFNYLSFDYLSFKIPTCPIATPFFDTLSQLCTDNCSNGQYFNISTAVCSLCLYSC